MNIYEQIKTMLFAAGVSDVGFAQVPDGPAGLPYAISLAVRLSDAIIDEIAAAPTFSYYHHYRTVNAFIDQMLMQTGLLLQRNGWRYLPIAASQSIAQDGERSHMGRYSHKKAAVLAGLGTIGKNALFLHRHDGPRVRLGTLFTDCPLPAVMLSPEDLLTQSVCLTCNRCVGACPAQALKGAEWHPGIRREEMIDVQACHQYMREHFMKIGRGAVCGICVRACPIGAGAAARPDGG